MFFHWLVDGWIGIFPINLSWTNMSVKMDQDMLLYLKYTVSHSNNHNCWFVIKQSKLHIDIKSLAYESPGALFKDTVLRNYSLEKWNSSISNVINSQTLIKTYHLRVLNSVPGAPISIFLILILFKNISRQIKSDGSEQ
jgi:hypothetical protein